MYAHIHIFASHRKLVSSTERISRNGGEGEYMTLQNYEVARLFHWFDHQNKNEIVWKFQLKARNLFSWVFIASIKRYYYTNMNWWLNFYFALTFFYNSFCKIWRSFTKQIISQIIHICFKRLWGFVTIEIKLSY